VLVDFTVLAVIVLAGLPGPLLAVPAGAGTCRSSSASWSRESRWAGRGWATWTPLTIRFSFLAEVGFGLVMFVAGTHVPVRDVRLRRSLGPRRGPRCPGGSRVCGSGRAARRGLRDGPRRAVCRVDGFVSAALILPIIDSLQLGGEDVLQLLPQVAIADAVCIVAILWSSTPRMPCRRTGALAVILAGAAIFVVLSVLEREGLRHRLHRVSETRHFALELRISLMILFSLAAVANGHTFRSCSPALSSGSPWPASERRDGSHDSFSR
jgi:hypothetical protein